MSAPQDMRVNLHVGTELAEGRYRLEARLGQGGTGAVYRALDRQEGRQVAIKLLDPARSRSGYLLKFKREFRAAGAPSPAWLKLHRDAIPPDLRQVAPEVPAPLSSLMMPLLACA